MDGLNFVIDHRTRKLAMARKYDDGEIYASIYLNNSKCPMEHALHESFHLALWDIGISFEVQERMESLLNKLSEELSEWD